MSAQIRYSYDRAMSPICVDCFNSLDAYTIIGYCGKLVDQWVTETPDDPQYKYPASIKVAAAQSVRAMKASGVPIAPRDIPYDGASVMFFRKFFGIVAWCAAALMCGAVIATGLGYVSRETFPILMMAFVMMGATSTGTYFTLCAREAKRKSAQE